MTVSKKEAMAGGMFHFAERCAIKRAGETAGKNASRITIERWRASGRCQTWVTRPEDFRLPIKHGLRDHSAITHLNADEFHTEASCPHGYT